MAKLMKFLGSAWFLTLVGLVLLSVLIWVAGPYLAIAGRQVLETPLARLIVILLLVLLWGIVLQVKQLRGRGTPDTPVSAPGTGESERQGPDGTDHVQMQARFVEAVKLLRRRRGRAGQQALPWYLVIGPPASGKSTLIRNSGLKFPVGGQRSGPSIRGAGASVACDWWFADDAVLMDMSGVCGDQHSDDPAATGGWQDFLRLLRRFRRNKPVNGVVVTMSMADLLVMDENERDLHMQTIRRRLDEVVDHLVVNVPVYLVLTKCDLLAGFTPFFEDLNAAQRSQVWGVTFAMDRTLGGTAARSFVSEFNLLLERINSRVADRLHDERDALRRAAIMSFPQQLASFGEVAREFVDGIFSGHTYGMPLLLRGVYLTSAVQEGEPVDPVMNAVESAFGLDEIQRPAPGAQSRSFFIEQALKGVVFAESGFAGINPLAERRRRRRLGAGYVAVTSLTVGLSACMGTSYLQNKAYLAEVQAALDGRPALPALGPSTDSAQFFATALQRLEALRPAVDAAARHEAHVPWLMRAGLYQGHAVSRRVQEAYRRELNSTLVPGLSARFREELAGNAGDLQALYYYLKGYLMLAQPQHADAEQLSSLADIAWQRVFPEDPVLQHALDSHFQVLLEKPGYLRASSLDDELVAQARNTLRAADLATLVYSSIKLDMRNQYDDSARLDKALGLFSDVFRRTSGRPLTQPWPAIYTQPVFATQVDAGIQTAVERFLESGWVLGTGMPDGLTRDRTVQQVITLYEQDYIRAWEELLEDLQLQPAGSLQEASMVAAKLSGNGSPLRLLLKLVRTHTNDMLRVPAGAGEAGNVKPAATAAVSGALSKAVSTQVARRSSVLAAALTSGDSVAAAASPGQMIEEHFAPLDQMLDGEPGATSLDRTLEVVAQLSKALLTMNAADIAQPNPQLLLAQQESAQLPAPLSGWVAALAGKSETLVATGARDALGEETQSMVGTDCNAFVKGRYPFQPSSQKDIPIQNFGELFGQGGTFDMLFGKSLAALIDTTATTWAWREGPNMTPGPADLPAQVQAADRIKRLWFRGGAQPEVPFTVYGITVSPPITRVVITVDGQELDSAKTSTLPMQWPGPKPGSASIIAYDTEGKAIGHVERTGDWALFRLLQSGRLTRRSDLDSVAYFPLAGGVAEISLRASSLRNPFLDKTVQNFRCPGGRG